MSDCWRNKDTLYRYLIGIGAIIYDYHTGASFCQSEKKGGEGKGGKGMKKKRDQNWEEGGDLRLNITFLSNCTKAFKPN